MITWSVVLQYFVTRLVLVCIYVTPAMKHIYTGIKYIALYNIICVWYRRNLLMRVKEKDSGQETQHLRVKYGGFSMD